MRRIVVALAIVLLPGPALAAQSRDVLKTVQQYVYYLNKDDMRAAAALCTSPESIVDDFPPHIWQGTNACLHWGSAFDAYNKQSGITAGVVTLGKSWHADVTGDRAYVVVPATFTYRQHQKPVVESGSVFTLALRKSGSVWRITGWAWADR